MTPEQVIDEALNSVLKASGQDYTLAQRTAIRSAVRKIMVDAYTDGADRAHRAARERYAWIRGSDPEKSGRYLVTDGEQVDVARWLPLRKVWTFHGKDISVHCWAGLPEPPR